MGLLSEIISSTSYTPRPSLTLDYLGYLSQDRPLLPLSRRFCFRIPLNQVASLLDCFIGLPFALKDTAWRLPGLSGLSATLCFRHTRYLCQWLVYNSSKVKVDLVRA